MAPTRAGPAAFTVSAMAVNASGQVAGISRPPRRT